MTHEPYDQSVDAEFDRITRRHPGGRTMTRPDPPRTSRDQATLMLGCGGFVLMLSLAVAVVTLAWRL